MDLLVLTYKQETNASNHGACSLLLFILSEFRPTTEHQEQQGAATLA